MAEDDLAIADLRKAIGRVESIPRPSLKREIYTELYLWLAKKLEIEVREEK